MMVKGVYFFVKTTGTFVLWPLISAAPARGFGWGAQPMFFVESWEERLKLLSRSPSCQDHRYTINF